MNKNICVQCKRFVENSNNEKWWCAEDIGLVPCTNVPDHFMYTRNKLVPMTKRIKEPPRWCEFLLEQTLVDADDNPGKISREAKIVFDPEGYRHESVVLMTSMIKNQKRKWWCNQVDWESQQQGYLSDVDCSSIPGKIKEAKQKLKTLRKLREERKEEEEESVLSAMPYQFPKSEDGKWDIYMMCDETQEKEKTENGRRIVSRIKRFRKNNS